MSMDRTIVITNELRAEAACAHIRANWQAMARDERPMAIRAYEHKENRSLEQQAVMWLRLADIAAQVWIDGRQFSDEVWHEHYKKELLPEEDGPTKMARKGYRKWAYLPDGSRSLVGSTTQLTVAGMAEYLTKLEAEGAGMGVRFSASPREVFR